MYIIILIIHLSQHPSFPQVDHSLLYVLSIRECFRHGNWFELVIRECCMIHRREVAIHQQVVIPNSLTEKTTPNFDAWL